MIERRHLMIARTIAVQIARQYPTLRDRLGVEGVESYLGWRLEQIARRHPEILDRPDEVLASWLRDHLVPALYREARGGTAAWREGHLQVASLDALTEVGWDRAGPDDPEHVAIVREEWGRVIEAVHDLPPVARGALLRSPDLVDQDDIDPVRRRHDQGDRARARRLLREALSDPSRVRGRGGDHPERSTTVRLDLTGQTYGRLTAIEPADPSVSPSGRTRTRWRCRCECGEVTEVRTDSLRDGHIRSCGCSQAKKAPRGSGSYQQAHARVRRVRGPASDHPCAACSDTSTPADEWAYDEGPAEAERSTDGRTWSEDPWAYYPLHRRCHRLHDRVGRILDAATADDPEAAIDELAPGDREWAREVLAVTR